MSTYYVPGPVHNRKQTQYVYNLKELHSSRAGSKLLPSKISNLLAFLSTGEQGRIYFSQLGF